MKKAAGIDIGNHSIKLIELESRKDYLELTNSAISFIQNGDIKKAIHELLSSINLTFKRVNISVAGLSVIVRYIELPPMKHEELRSAIKFEGEKYIPFKLEEAIVDCAVLDKTGTGSQRVLLVAVKRKEVESLLSLFKDSGLTVNIVDIDSFALLNAFDNVKHGLDKNSTYGLINLGAKFSNMNIVTNGDAYFTRDLLWGGGDLSNRIKDAMGVNFEEAEALKKKPSAQREEIVSSLTPVLERLSSNIRMSFDYFESQFGKNVEKLFISGGTSYLFNIVDFLKDNLGVDVKLWNPFEGVRMPGHIKEIDESPSIFTIAMGLALRI